MTAEDRERTIAYVALGSNIDKREHYLQGAIAALNEESGITVTGQSSIYETEPVGYVDQSAFLNMVIQIHTDLSPEALLVTLLAIENRLGRTRDLRWGPRTIDLDLLLYGDHQLTTPDLIIPHPRMHERAFVLVPLSEVLYARQDALFESISAHLEKLEGKEGVILWKKSSIAQRIRAFRKLKGYTQSELADLLGVSIAILGAIERGTRKPDNKMIHNISQVLNIEPEELVAVVVK